jgi:hypothetical protein
MILMEAIVKKMLLLLLAIVLILSCSIPLEQTGNAVPTSPQEQAVPAGVGPVDGIETASDETLSGAQGIGMGSAMAAGAQDQVWDSQNANTPLLHSYFQASPNIRWYWAGCTTMIGINSAAREILLLDGYVSKSAIGLSDFDMYWLGKDKIERYFRFLSGYLDQGYQIKGLLVTHGHADHMGDIPILMHLLKKNYPALANFPIITDFHTYRSYCSVINLAVVYPLDFWKIKWFRDLVTDLIVYNPGNGAAVPVSTVRTVVDTNEFFAPLSIPGLVAQVSTHGDSYSSRYQIYNIASRSYTSTNIIPLGGFQATAFLMDHAYLPAGNDDSLRVNAFQVWGRDNPDNKKVMFMDSTNIHNFITECIYTDHLFLTWAPSASWTMTDTSLGHNREYTALAVKSSIRFLTPGLHYIIPMHVDDIALGTFDRTVVCSSSLWTKSSGWVWTGFPKGYWAKNYEPSHPYSMPSVFLSDAEFRSRSFPANSRFKRSWNINPPRVDLIGHITARQPYNQSPSYYWYRPQGGAYQIRFAIINNRVGLEF